MATRWTGYTSGTEGLRQSVENIANRQYQSQENALNRANQLEILSAQLKTQKEIADERNKTTIEAAEISGRQKLEQIGASGEQTRETVVKKGDVESTLIGERGAITKEVKQMDITSAKEINLANITSRQLEVDKNILAKKNEYTYLDLGVSKRHSERLATDVTLRNLTDNALMKRLNVEITGKKDITNLQQKGEMAQTVKRLQSNYLIAEMSKDGALDRLVKQIASTENLAGLDNEAKMQRLRESLLNDNVMQTFIQNNLNQRQLTGIDAKKELTEFVEGAVFKRLNLDLQSREALQKMIEGGKSFRDQNQFLYNMELQLDRANQKMAQQIESQEHQTIMAEQKFEQAKELGNVNFERDVLKSILGIKMKGEAERQSFNFLASPFSLGKTSNFMGINYKEKDVLDQVGKNLPTLAEAVRIARNIPDDITTEDGGWFSRDKEVSTMPPKKAQLLKVLVNYQNELSGSEFYNWGESSSIKKDAKMKLGDVNSLIEMLNTPSSSPYESIGISTPY